MSLNLDAADCFVLTESSPVSGRRLINLARIHQSHLGNSVGCLPYHRRENRSTIRRCRERRRVFPDPPPAACGGSEIGDSGIARLHV